MQFSSEQIEKIMSWIYKGLSATVIPLLYWLNSISVENAVINTKLYTLQNQIQRIDYQVYEIKKEINSDAIQDAQSRQSIKDIEKNIDNVQKNLVEIQNILIKGE
jgi:chromosome segregation ATPase